MIGGRTLPGQKSRSSEVGQPPGGDGARRPESGLSAAAAILISTVFGWAYTVVLMILAARRTHWLNVYNIDDAYIHLAVSRNLALHGVWGINPTEFSGASSSPLWTVILAACIKILGPRELIPLAINFLAAPLVMTAAWLMLRRWVSGVKLLLVLLGIIMALPVGMLIVNGMEQELQVALILAFLAVYVEALWPRRQAADAVERPNRTPTSLLIWGAVLAFLLTGARYEGLFVVFCVCATLVFHRRWGTPIAWGAGAWAAVGAYAAYSIHAGGLWLPYSVLVKGNALHGLSAHEIHRWLSEGIGLQGPRPPLVLLAPAAFLLIVALWRDRRDSAAAVRNLAAIFIVAFILHAQFAFMGSVWRYEAYLVIMGCVVMIAGYAAIATSQAGWRFGLSRLAGYIAVVVFVVTILIRTVYSFQRTVIGPQEILDQQIQMAQFVHDFYPHESVAINDIGAVSWYGNAHVVDLWGLGNRRICVERMHGQYNPAALDAICRAEHADIAMVYPKWYEPYGGVPSNWQLVGTWTIPHAVAAALPTVYFYATTPAAKARLLSSMLQFEHRQPKFYGVARHD